MFSPLKVKEKLGVKPDDSLCTDDFSPNNDLSNLVPVDNKKKDPYIPTEQFLLIFPSEWTEYFRNFDDSIIPVIQYFHLKRTDTRSILNKLIGGLMYVFSYIMTCKTLNSYIFSD